MNRFTLGCIGAALLTFAAPAGAAPTVFSYSGVIDTFTAPTTGEYSIFAYGARGGAAS